MEKYYDEKCPLCESCHWFGYGEYSSGERYEACRYYGYILHRMVDAGCEGHVTEEEWIRKEEINKKIKKLRR